jgi:preprotein translocase subunit SecF
MSEHHKFRYLLPPGNNFAFVSKFKAWLIFSIITMAASVGLLFVNKHFRGEYMNWTIDFKGGTEIVFAFQDKATGNTSKLDLGKARAALEEIDKNIEVSDMSWEGPRKSDGALETVNGMIVRTTRFGVLTPDLAQATVDEVTTAFKDRGVQKAAWSGERLNVRSTSKISYTEMAEVLKKHNIHVKEWSDDERKQYEHADEGTKEFNQWYAIEGLGTSYEAALEKAFPSDDVLVINNYAVGAKAGEKLRNDGVKAIIYAILLIMLYLAFRFDIRYAPAAAFATLHDGIIVIGVFAATWTEVSLTTVAGLLTIMGFSTNDTVIVFDRIRENQAKLKDKKIERIIDISLNEMLVRSILTSATVFATTLIMNIFGTGLVKNFAFTMNVGVIVGVYSSLFLAPPVFMWISRKWYSGPPKRRAIPASAASAPQPSKTPDDE